MTHLICKRLVLKWTKQVRWVLLSNQRRPLFVLAEGAGAPIPWYFFMEQLIFASWVLGVHPWTKLTGLPSAAPVSWAKDIPFSLEPPVWAARFTYTRIDFSINMAQPSSLRASRLGSQPASCRLNKYFHFPSSRFPTVMDTVSNVQLLNLWMETLHVKCPHRVKSCMWIFSTVGGGPKVGAPTPLFKGQL